jgi:hypothetical protein
MIKTYKIKHEKDFHQEIRLAKKVARYAIGHPQEAPVVAGTMTSEPHDFSRGSSQKPYLDKRTCLNSAMKRYLKNVGKYFHSIHIKES